MFDLAQTCRERRILHDLYVDLSSEYPTVCIRRNFSFPVYKSRNVLSLLVEAMASVSTSLKPGLPSTTAVTPSLLIHPRRVGDGLSLMIIVNIEGCHPVYSTTVVVLLVHPPYHRYAAAVRLLFDLKKKKMCAGDEICRPPTQHPAGRVDQRVGGAYFLVASFPST